ncbi:MAG TPA: tetratricopeptide repeat protein [bacterium]|nr:tetratricopeptide repeat protein [bacterium]
MNAERYIPVLLVFLFLGLHLYADPQITYLEGSLEVSVGGSWQEVDMGDLVPEMATIRLGHGSVAELNLGSARITLGEPGTYSIQDLFRSSRELDRWKIRSILNGRMRSLFRGPPQGETASMGARAAEVEDEGMEFEWVDEEEEVLTEAESMLEEGGYEEAIAILEESYLDAFDPSPYLFYIGYARAMLGQKGLALKALNEVEVEGSMPHYAEFVLLKGELLMEGQAYAQALDLYQQALNSFTGEALAQSMNFFAAYCAEQLGQAKQARRFLEEAQRIDPQSETGRAAGAQLDGS